ALDEALVPHARRLRIGRSNFLLLSDISSKESTLQLVYNVLRQTPFFKAFLVTTDVLEVYMQEFWATATVHHHSIRSFAAIINKCLSGKSSGYDSLRLSQAQFLWGFYHNRNVDFVYLLREDFVYQVEHKDTKKSNKMYYPSSDTRVTPPTAVAGSNDRDEGIGIIPGVLDVPTEESAEEISWKYSDEEGDDDDDDNDEGDTGDDDEEGNNDDDDAQDDDDHEDEGDDDEGDQEEGSDDEQASDEEEFIHPSLSTHDEEETKDEESFDPIAKTPKNTDDEGNGEENLEKNVRREEGQDEEYKEDELYRDVNINLGRGVQMADVQTTQEFKDSHVTLTPVNPDGQQQSSSVSSQFVTSMLNPTPDVGIESIFEKTSQMDFDRLRDEAQAENDESLKTIDENMQKIIKEQVKEQVKVQVSKILLKIEQTVNEQLEAEVLTRSSKSSNTSYAIAVDLSEMELKKILIEKIVGNKSIHRSNKQRNIYRALVEAYESNKIVLDTYRDTVTLKRRRDDDVNKDEESSIGSDQGSKRQREGKEPESTSAPK
nr:hypothetical protein [Tanacetum cinerariifolium]